MPPRKSSLPPYATPRPLPARAPSPGVAPPLERLLDHAADVLQAVRAGRSPEPALAAVPADARAGAQAIAFHALRWLGTALALRERLAERTPPPPVDALLLTALAQLWPVDAPPYADHVLVDQAVRCAQRRAPAAAAFINAVLRRCARERRTLAVAVAQQPQAAWNHPAWWIERLRHGWPQQWQALLAAANLRPPMMLRVNARRGDAAGYVRRLADERRAAVAIGSHAVLLAEPCPVEHLPGFSEGLVSVQDWHAQQAAPLLVGAGTLRLPAGARVLDACAAPGGKTAHLLELADLDVLALDNDAPRLARVQQSALRLGLPGAHELPPLQAVSPQFGTAPRPQATLPALPAASFAAAALPVAALLPAPGAAAAPGSALLAPGSALAPLAVPPSGAARADADRHAHAHAHGAALSRDYGPAARLRLAIGDAREPRGWWDGRPFDAILLDAPCSASGIVRRHPDVRWLRRADDIAALARVQAQMLDALWPLLAPGGRLLFATCSLFRAEGSRVVDAFLQRLGDGSAQLDPASPGHLLPLADNGMTVPAPGLGVATARAAAAAVAPGDGFFYALLHKRRLS